MDNVDQLPTVFPVTSHTDHVGSGSTFVVINGFNENGIRYIPQALVRGAQHIIVQHDTVIPPDSIALINKTGVTINRVDNTRLALAQLSAQAAGYPAKRLKIIGVTGTKGKTTTVFLLAHILGHAGYKTALISTVKNIIDGHRFASSLTTPQPDYLHQFFKQCIKANVEYVVMEVTAQALSLHRTHGIQFNGIIFTNFSHEHLEFYETLDDYFKAKCLLFDQIKSKAPVIINADNAYCKALKRPPDIIWFSMLKPANFIGNLIDSPLKQISLTVNWNLHTHTFTCPHLIGIFNGYNLLNAVAMALQLGIPPDTITAALLIFSGIPGRMEQYSLPNNSTAVIDYAHNPESYQAVLSLLREMTPHLIVIFGAGGNRDTTKRPIMGKIAAQIADIVILTADNPRTEDPEQIVNDIENGIPKHLKHKIFREIDRKKAIQKGYIHSRINSIVAILGKGAAEYQIIGNKKTYFSEKTIVQQLG